MSEQSTYCARAQKCGWLSRFNNFSEVDSVWQVPTAFGERSQIIYSRFPFLKLSIACYEPMFVENIEALESLLWAEPVVNQGSVDEINDSHACAPSATHHKCLFGDGARGFTHRCHRAVNPGKNHDRSPLDIVVETKYIFPMPFENRHGVIC